MKIAHIILVHKNPQQVARLIKSLRHDDVDCWVHIDKKWVTKEFKIILNRLNVFFITPEQRVDWGCFNTVEAMLYSLKQVVNCHNTNYDYVNFLSGQDYPIRPAFAFIEYLSSSAGHEFMGIAPYNTSSDLIRRIHQYDFRSFSIPANNLLSRACNKILPPRRFPFDFDIRKGPQWITITRGASIYILDFVKNNPAYSRYFKKVHISDEFFFQTILFNSPFKTKIKDLLFHYTDWSELRRHPKTLTTPDYQKLAACEHCFFARKFDMNVDSTILDIIDDRLTKYKQHELTGTS